MFRDSNDNMAPRRVGFYHQRLNELIFAAFIIYIFFFPHILERIASMLHFDPDMMYIDDGDLFLMCTLVLVLVVLILVVEHIAI
jgi:hypothetical protein